MNNILLAFDSFKEERFAVISKPAEENACSDAELVVGTAYTQHISLYKLVYINLETRTSFHSTILKDLRQAMWVGKKSGNGQISRKGSTIAKNISLGPVSPTTIKLTDG
ncbi:uncharacterized protein LOC116843637 [Odontomachus brunneus]|uniref:uncharacterized protein LOC116843637 n=1 Tax=Odontomachus brunneus TaxID=486640 RepID=UPI0013F2526A|nr:uncharacterized protein LOC116843637 [Odontomachus brunneus]